MWPDLRLQVRLLRAHALQAPADLQARVPGVRQGLQREEPLHDSRDLARGQGQVRLPRVRGPVQEASAVQEAHESGARGEVPGAVLGGRVLQDVLQRGLHEVARARSPQAAQDDPVPPVWQGLQVEVQPSVPQEEGLQNQTHQTTDDNRK